MSDPAHDDNPLARSAPVTPAATDWASEPESDEGGNDAAMGDLAEAAAWLPIPPGTAPELARLRGRQRHALYELMDGGTHAGAARLAGVNRRTVHRWVNQDPVFRAALEGWRRSAIQTAEDRLTLGIDMAVDTLVMAAEEDYRAAAILLKGRGLLSGPPRSAAPPAAAGGAGAAAAELVSVNVLSALGQAVPSGKRRDFEVRLRELILSFHEEPAGAADAAAQVSTLENGPPHAEPAAMPESGHCDPSA